MERLFDLPALEVEAQAAARFSALGTAAELILTGRLLELGYRVAVPVTDDDGVDLIVNYALKVQVKSSASRNVNGLLMVGLTGRRSAERGAGPSIKEHIDIVAVYARDSRCWWFIPRHEIGSSKAISVSEHGRKATWLEAWHVFHDLTGGGS